MPSAIGLKKVSKIFAEELSAPLAVLKDINLEIEAGEFFIFLGPSGSGKSTLLRIMSGLEKSFQGEIKFSDGITRRDLGFVFQQFALLPWLTVEENVGLGLTVRRLAPAEQKAMVLRELAQFGLERFAGSYPRELSGGMRQRVGLARALVAGPKVIFMDEPFSELDSFIAAQLREDLLQVWQERKTTIVMVTHLIQEALELADRIAVLTARPGRVEKIVENRLPRPRDRRAPEFFRMEDELFRLVKP